MEAQDDKVVMQLLHSFNMVSAMYGEDMDSVMANTAIEIIGMKDIPGIINKTFFERGILLLTDCEGIVAHNVKACLFWWVFNEERMENEIKHLIETKSKI